MVHDYMFSRLWGDSVEKLPAELCLCRPRILAERSRFLRGAHFAAIDVEFGHFPKVLGGSGQEELIICAARTT